MKDNHKYLKRFLAFALTLAMVITYMPINMIAYAENEAPAQPAAEEVVDNTANTETPAAQDEVKTEEPAPVQEEVTETEPAPAETPAVEEEQAPADEQQVEEPAEETPAEETAEPEKEVSFPAQTFNADKGGVKVLVKAPEGALPEGTEMVVTPANTKAVEQAVKDAVDGEVTGFKAVDITFVKDGEDVEPKVPVQVYLNASGLDADANKSVVHIADSGVAEVVDDATVNKAGIAKVVTDQFSVYAVVGTDDGINEATARRTYKFVLDNDDPYFFTNTAGDKVDYQIVKNGDKLVAPDPDPTKSNSGTEDGAWKFDGWYNGDTKVTFGSAESGITKDETVPLKAKFSRVFYVHYYDTEYDIEGTKVQNIMKSQEVAEGESATVDSIQAVPLSTNEKFAGWSTSKDASEVEYEAGDSLGKMTKDINLYPVLEPAYWIHYYGNGDKASYTAPTQFFATENTVKPENPTRVGYTFKEWCTDKAGTTPFTWGSKLTADQNLYASWTPSDTTYKVIIWQENADDDGYSFYDSVKKTGKSGEMTNVTAESFTGFHLYGTDTDETDDAYKLTQQKIAGDGSTIVNVYYNRNDYQVKFYNSNGSRIIDELTITAKYQQTITDKWPSRRSELSRTYPVIWRVNKNYNPYGNNTYQSNISQMPENGATFYYQEEGTRYVMTTNYYIQTTNGGNNFTLDHSDVFNSDENNWYTTVEDYYDIKGFTVNFASARAAGGHANYATDTSVHTSEAVGSGYSSQGGGRYKVDFYYLRNKYTVKFDLNGATGEDPTPAEVYYEKSLSGIAPADYVVDKTQYTDSQGKVYLFKGWYDNNEGAGDAFDFDSTTMPANNLNLYAKWEEQNYKINIDPNGGVLSDTESTFYNVKFGEPVYTYDDVRRDYVANDSGTFYYHLDKRPEKVTPETPRKAYYVEDASASTDGGKKYIYEKDAYQLIGWYDAETDKPFNSGSSVTKDTNLVAKWKRVGKFTVTIFYNDAEGNPQTIEGLSYSDQATAVAPTSVPYTPEGKTLVGWTIKKTGAKLNLGESFTVDAATMSEKKDGKEIIEIDPIFENNAKLNVTKITFNANGGTGEVKPLEALDLNGNESVDNNKVTLPSDGFTRDGYQLIGWSAKSGDNTVEYILGGDYAADGETNTLYAVWAEKIDVTVTGEIVSDEVYDGNEKTNAKETPKGYTVTASGKATADASSLVDVTLADSVKAPATGIDAGEYPMGLSNDTVTVALKGETKEIRNAGKVVVNNKKYYILGSKTVEDGKLTIAKNTNKVTVTITENSDEVTYDGKPHTIKGYKSIVADNKLYDVTTAVKETETAAWTVTKTDAGTYDMGIVAADFENIDNNFSNVEFKIVDGQLKINPVTDKVTVTVTENSDEVTYDGKPHTIKGYKSIVADNELYDVTTAVKETETADWTVTKTNAGTYDMGIKAADFENIDNNFTNVEFKIVDGQLKINPVSDKVTVTVTENSDKVTYDGKEHTIKGYKSIAADNDLYDVTTAVKETETADWTVTKINTGSYDMGIKAADFQNTDPNFTNVVFEIVDGKLIIDPTQDKVTVTITEKSDKVTYDGKPHTIKGYKSIVASDPNYDVKSVKETETNAWTVTETDAGTYPMGIVAADFQNTDPNFTNVEFVIVDGDLVIDPITDKVTVTVTENSGKATYDGKAHTIKGYKTIVADNELYDVATAVKETETADWTVTKTNAGTYDMGIKAADFANIDKNFTNVEFKIVDGQLVIDKSAQKVTVTITENSDEATYDGKDHTIKGYKSIVADNNLYDVTKAVKETETKDWTVTKKDAGTYDMGIKAADFENIDENFSNVEFVIVDGTLKINKKAVTLTSGDATKSYDATALTNDDVEGKNANGLTVETGWVEGEGATYTFNGTQTLVGSSANKFEYKLNNNTKADNYTITKTEGTLTVTDENVPDDKVVNKTDGENNDKTKYHVGDTVTWTIKVKNIYAEEKKLTVTEQDGVTIKGTVPETLKAGEEITLTATHVITAADVAAGSYKNTVTVKLGDLEKKGDDEVQTEPIEIEITAASDSKSYDGTALTNKGYKQTAGKLAEGHKIDSVKVEGSQTLVGSSKNVASEAKIVDADGKDVTAGYAITYVDGTLTVTDKNVPDDKVVNKTDGENNDGKAYHVGDTVTWTIKVKNIYAEEKKLTVTELDGVTIEGEVPETLKAGEEITLTAKHVITGDDVAAGTYKNTVTVKLGDLEKKGDDEVETEPIDIEITAGSGNKVYDGTALTNDEYELSKGTLVDGDQIESVQFTGSQTDAGESKNKASNAKIVNAAGEDVTKGYNITYVDGTLTVTKRPVTIKSESAEKSYDGTELTKHAVTVDGFAEGEGLEAVKVTGTQTLVGSSENTFEYKLFGDSIFRKIKLALNIEDTDAYDPAKAGVNKETKAENYDITVEYGTLTVTDDVKPEDLDKVTTKTHEDKEYKLGETVVFTIEATNIYDEPKTITVEEQEGVTITSESKFENVEPGAKVTVTAEYVVTEADIIAGEFHNQATVTIGDKPFKPEDTVDVEDSNPHLTVVKETTSTPANGKEYEVGETVTYEITVTNDGNLTVKDIEVKDDLTGDKWNVESLAPEQSQTFDCEYTVTEEDAKNGSVTNIATATGITDDPNHPTPTVVPGEKTVPVIEPADDTKKGVKTGDDNNFGGWLAMMMLAGAGASGLFIRRRREDEE